MFTITIILVKDIQSTMYGYVLMETSLQQYRVLVTAVADLIESYVVHFSKGFK